MDLGGRGAEGWGRLYNEELHNLEYTSPNIIMMVKSRRIGWARHVGRMRGNAYKSLVRKSVGKKLLGRSRHTWEEN
jgi:hypothetical protein